MGKIADIQKILGVTPDNIWGRRSQAALDKLLSAPSVSIKGKASSFADAADVAAFRRCKAQGKSDATCFKVGDNGIGCWGDDTTNVKKAFVAVPPDDMIDRWGSVNVARHKPVKVTINGKTKTCILGDRLPYKRFIKNGVVIDLAPGAQKMFNLKPPFLVAAEWSWS